jgi:hypothetical protein
MASFALITEGITDQIFLEALLNSMFDDVDVNPLQPVRDETDQNRQGNHGGWEKIFEHCQNDESILSALSSNDYVVIHIDTDCAEHVNFGVALTENGADKTDERLIAEVKELIASKVNTDIYQSYQNQILFAVAVHSLECWLFAFYAPLNYKPRTKQCSTHFQTLLSKMSKPYQKTAPCYDALCDRNTMRKRDLACAKSRSLSIFVADLMRINQSND